MQTLTQAQYNNLLPVPAMRPHLQHVRDADPAHDRFLFWGTAEEWQDAMRRCAYLDRRSCLARLRARHAGMSTMQEDRNHGL